MPSAIFSDSIASGASTSAGVDLTQVWGNVSVRIGSMSTSAALTIQNSDDGGTTYYNIFHPPIQSVTVGTPLLTIASGVGANGGVVALWSVADSMQKVRFVATGTVGNGVAIKVIVNKP